MSKALTCIWRGGRWRGRSLGPSSSRPSRSPAAPPGSASGPSSAPARTFHWRTGQNNDHHHGNNGLDRLAGGLLPAAVEDEAGAEIPDVEGDPLQHGVHQPALPLLSKLWTNICIRCGGLLAVWSTLKCARAQWATDHFTSVFVRILQNFEICWWSFQRRQTICGRWKCCGRDGKIYSEYSWLTFGESFPIMQPSRAGAWQRLGNMDVQEEGN